MIPFTHLHVHSHYSILDGMSKVPDLVEKCRKNGMNSMALTDHGNMYGIKELLDYCNKINAAPHKKVKECKENIIKAQEQINQLPMWQAQVKTTTDEHELASLKQKIRDAQKAQKDLPIYQAELPKLEEKEAAYQPFKPIVGVEAYCARRNRKDKDKSVKQYGEGGKEIIVDRSGWHLILLAKNKTGYQNLCKMVSLAFIEGFYDRPRIDKELLAQYHEGIIVSSACLGGELPQLIMAGKVEEAEKTIQWFKSIFGEDYYLEVQRHQTDKPNADRTVFEKQQAVIPVLIDLAQKTNTKIICTNDVHFVEEEHAEAHERLICLATGHFMDDTNRMHYTKQEWLKTPEQMAAIFSDMPYALSNTQEIADKVEPYSIDSAPIMPKFPIPEAFGTEEEYRQKFSHEDLFNEFTRNENGEVVLSQDAAEKKIKALGGYDRLYRIKLEADYLAQLTWAGAHKRYGEVLTQEQQDRIRFELHIMKTMGFPGYFLIVMDYIRAAREELNVSVGPGRGSAAGSVVAYCLWITDVDPLKYDLLFERFLNPDRISLPDIDVDFDDAGRAKVLDYVSHKYGTTHVAHIITYGTMATKSAIADVGRVQRVPLSKVNEIKGYVPDKFPDDLKDAKGKPLKVNLANCYKYVNDLKTLLNGEDTNVASMLHYAQELEDTIRQVGIHACGVIIGADDLTKFAPLATVKDRVTGQDVLVTQYDGHVVESVGLIKMDFLGLRTLTIIKEALANIRKSKGIEVDIDHIPTDDALTYKLFQEGRTVGIFQFESAGMQKYLKELKPTVLGDLIAMNALYRPGPMDYIPQFINRKLGREPITYDLDCMEKYLKDTYGVTVYQEQVMLLSRLIAGFTRGESDQLRKAMGKKIDTLLNALYPKFIEGGKKNGHDPAILDKIWKDWQAFAKYAFNKSHATCYAWVAYQTAYLKAHYPAEFMAANLTVSKDDIATVTKFMDECKAMGIGVLEPDVNESDLNFTVNQKGNIRFGLGGIKGVGEGAVEMLIQERQNNGRYLSLYDFLERVNLQSCNRKTLESLALSGAFDCFEGVYREQLLADTARGEKVLDTLIRYGNNFQNAKKQNENSLFGAFGGDTGAEIRKPDLPQVERWSSLERLNKEKSLIGIFLSAHPLDEFRFEIEQLCNCTSRDMAYFESLRDPKSRLQGAPSTAQSEEQEQETEAATQTPQEWLDEHMGRPLRLGGIITKAESLVSKNNNPYGRYTLEDYAGSYTFALFGEAYKVYASQLLVHCYVSIGGIIQQKGASYRYFKPKPAEEAEYEFVVNEVIPLQDLKAQKVQKIMLTLPLEHLTGELTASLVRLCAEHTGTTPLSLWISDETGENRVMLSGGTARVNVDKTVYQFLQANAATEVFTYKVLLNG